MENIYTVASTSSSTTYGNVMMFFKEYLVSHFSVNYFKDVNLSSEIAYVNIRRRLGRNTRNEISKLERPFLTIVPQIQNSNNEMFLYDTPLTKSYDNMDYVIQENTMFPIIKNIADGYTLNYKLNRDQIQFECTITLDTYIQQIDLYKFMSNYFTWDRPYTVYTSIESMIPREIVRHMGILSNINIDDESSNQTPIILQMMNRHARYPITYKMRNSTALDEFYMYYNVNLLVNFTDLSMESVNRKGMADDYYQITFRTTIDFNLPGIFILTGQKPRLKEFTVNLESKNHNGSSDIIPMYTINNLYAKYASVKNGYILYTNTRFKTERDPKTKRDSLGLDVLFEDEYIKVLHTYYSNNIPMNTLVEIILLKNGQELNKDIWRVNWNTLDLIIEEADDSATYCLLIYINNLLFNENIINNTESEQKEKSKI